MTIRKIDLLDDSVNCPVVQVEGRSYPGVIIQGDSLFSLYKAAERVLQFGEDQYGCDAAEFIRDSLKEYLLIYESVLNKKGMVLPYVKS